MTCLRPRQSCDCRPSASYEQLRTSPPTFTMLTSTAPHQVTSQAGSLHLMGMSYLGSLWPQPGPLQDLPPLLWGGCHQDSQSSPHPTMGLHVSHMGQSRGDAHPVNMGGMPPLRKNHPTTQSQQPHQQATPYVPTVDVPRRVSFALETSTSTGTSSYYSDAVRRSVSGDRQS